MAKRKNEETVFQSTVSPSENLKSEPKEVEQKESKKQHFEVVGPKGLNFAIGGRYFNTGSEDWYSPGGRKFAGIAENQTLLKWVYDFGPIGKNWVKAPDSYKAPWGKFVK